LGDKNLCTAGNGFQIKLTVSNLQDWFNAKTRKPYVGEAGENFKELSEAATLLSLDKSVLIQHNTTCDMICPNLNILQIHHLVTAFQPDKFFSEPVPLRVIQELSRMCEQSAGGSVFIEERDVALDMSFLKLSLAEQQHV